MSRYGLLVTEGPLILPASSLFEIPFIDSYLWTLRSVRAAGLLDFWSPTPDLDEYAVKKRGEYRDQAGLFAGYSNDQPVPTTHMKGLVWRPRTKRSASKDITMAWLASVESENDLWRSIFDDVGGAGSSPGKVENKIYDVPVNLEGRAFVVDNIQSVMPFRLPPKAEVKINIFISRAYIESLLDEYDALIWTQTPIGELDCNITSKHSDGRARTISYRKVERILIGLGIKTVIDRLSWKQLISLRSSLPVAWLCCEVQKYARGDNTFVNEINAIGLSRKIAIEEVRNEEDLIRRSCLIQDEILRYRELVLDKLSSNYERNDIVDAQTETRASDIAIIVALPEEFRKAFGKFDMTPSWKEEQGMYVYDFSWGGYVCSVTFVGGMGPTKAGLHTLEAINITKPKTVINIGIAGAMDSDVMLGDVVIADVVDGYLENSKVVDVNPLPKESSKNSGEVETEDEVPEIVGESVDFKFLLSGEPFRTTSVLVTHAENFEFVHAKAFEKFKIESLDRRSSMGGEGGIMEDLVKRELFRSEATVLVGHVASGPAVSASEKFVGWLKNTRDRKYIAVEMESFGVLLACARRGNDTFVIRGISDFGDERKKQLDNVEGGSFRTLALEEAISFLGRLIEAGVFKR